MAAPKSLLTVPKAFRITRTQAFLLDSPKYKNRASAIVRALLGMYLNGRLNIEEAIDDETRAAGLRMLKGKKG